MRYTKKNIRSEACDAQVRKTTWDEHVKAQKLIVLKGSKHPCVQGLAKPQESFLPQRVTSRSVRENDRRFPLGPWKIVLFIFPKFYMELIQLFLLHKLLTEVHTLRSLLNQFYN